jgi:uncharacterized protein (TIGR03086 family)
MTTRQDPDLDALTSLSSRLVAVLGAIGDHQLTWATPCSDWDLAALVDHVTGGNWFTAQISDGHTADEAMTRTIEQFKGSSASSVEATSSVNDQLMAFRQPGALDRTWHHVAADLTGGQILRLRLHDLLVHTWDIEQTLDPPASLSGDLVRWGLAELSDSSSLASELFELTTFPSPEAIEDPAVAYLHRFGRSAISFVPNDRPIQAGGCSPGPSR